MASGSGENSQRSSSSQPGVVRRSTTPQAVLSEAKDAQYEVRAPSRRISGTPYFLHEGVF